MTRPQRYLWRMLLFVAAVVVLAAALFPALSNAFMANVALNGLILGVLALGIIYIIRQVVQLGPEVRWLETFRRRDPGLSVQPSPRLLAPISTLLGERQGRVSLSATTTRALLDSIRTRLEEGRDISRYMIGLLVFLGLLGTFWGLLETVSSIASVIGGLTATTSDITAFFNDLKNGLKAPLGGMGTAFSSSLLGLSGSLILGFLDLQASQAQNRFYNDLEEWLSSLTKISIASPAAAALSEGEQAVPIYLEAVVEKIADSLETLQRTIAQGEDGRRGSVVQLTALNERLSSLVDQMRTEQNLMLRLAENQVEMKPILARLADAMTGASSGDEVTRAHIRSIEVYLMRLLDEVAAGRAQTLEEIRGEIRLLARTIAALADDSPPKRPGVASRP
ncbi:MAG: flagellar motor protein MotA [Proteobacteria bacterium]|nr:flagellar motor protein MotA [Pseudomonadota bacterium]MBI3496534.1 flagellar motor protein MotA [Pseudomonadota bacterium]